MDEKGSLEKDKKTFKYGLECEVPLGNCFDVCLSEKCSKRSKCFNNCEATCFGLSISPCALGIFKRKTNFISIRGEKQTF